MRVGFLMGEVSIRDLRHHGGDVIDRVARGEVVTVTRSGSPVAELRPLRRPGLTSAELVRRRAHLPAVDPEVLRRDVDTVVDMTL